jgi:amidophosphoribosyltransferase
MSSVSELFAPKYMTNGPRMTPEIEARMASDLGADSLRYLPLEAVARAVDKPKESLCQACLNGEYPTPAGRALYQISLQKSESAPASEVASRVIELDDPVAART